LAKFIHYVTQMSSAYHRNSKHGDVDGSEDLTLQTNGSTIAVNNVCFGFQLQELFQF